MVVTAYPDLAAAIKVRLAAESTITTKTSTRIYLEWPYASLEVPPYLTAIMVEAGRGGLGDVGLGRQAERVDIACYGADRRSANELWRIVNAYLVPPIGSSTRCSFRTASTAVVKVTQESGPIRLTDPDSGWPLTRGSYIFEYRMTPVVTS